MFYFLRQLNLVPVFIFLYERIEKIYMNMYNIIYNILICEMIYMNIYHFIYFYVHPSQIIQPKFDSILKRIKNNIR